MRPPKPRCFAGRKLGGVAVACLLAASAHAQVIRDNTLGTGRGALVPGGDDFQISVLMGARRGQNLFQSFEKFDLQSHQSATFETGGALNILARVTDRNPSSINGAINANANLFLMNPAGIVFGESARVNVTGSFFATTADYIKLGIAGKFSADTNGANDVLTMAAPSAFGFLTPNRAAIRVQGSALGGEGLKTLGLIGGDVIVEGGAVLRAEDVQLISTRSAGEATLRLPDSAGLRPYATINAENFAVHGSVSVGSPTVPNEPPPPRTYINSNRVVIRGGTLVVKNAEAVATAIRPGDGVAIKTSGNLTVGDESILESVNLADLGGRPAVDVTAGSANILGVATISSRTQDPGVGGDLRLNINGTLSVTEFSTILTESDSLVRGGDLHIAAGSANLDSSFIMSQANSTAKNGDISLQVAGPLSITNGTIVQLVVQQASQDRIVVNAQDVTISGPGTQLLFLDQFEEGIGGAIQISASRRLAILNGAQVNATAVSRAGASIGISAQSVLISGTGASPGSTGISAETTARLGTHGGNITMDIAGLLEVLDGGAIASNTISQGDGGDILIRARDMVVTGPNSATALDAFAPPGITAQNLPLADGVESGSSGSISLNLSGRLEVRNGGLVAVDTTASGRGGSIGIAADSMSVASGGIVTARTLAAAGGGRGGDISIDSSELEVLAGGQITAATLGSGAGGSLSIRSGEVFLRGRDALVSATSGSPSLPAAGPGGNILMQADLVQIEDGARINVGTLGTGAGGNISVSTDTLRISSSSDITGISAQTLNARAGGPGGTVQIDTRSVSMSGAGATITTQSFGAGMAGQIRLASDTLVMSDGSKIQSSSTGAGHAGSVAVDASGAITLNSGSAIQSSSTGTGNAGSITIDASGDINLNGGSSFSVAATQSNAGDINVRSATSITLTDSSITAEAALNGGNIDIRAIDTLFLSNSQITAAAGINGGNIFIDPQFVIFQNSLVSANAILGRGGNIRIISDFFLSSLSAVTATSQLGIDGTVHIDALNTDLTGSLVELPDSLVNAESLLQELCTVKVDEFSSFISEGRGGLPPLPGESLPSLMIVQ